MYLPFPTIVWIENKPRNLQPYEYLYFDMTKQIHEGIVRFFIEREIRQTPTIARNTLNSLDKILLEGTHEGLLLLSSLESTVTELGGGVDPLEVDLLGGTAGGLGVQGLAESHDTLLDTGNGALEHDEVVLDLTVVNEATKTVIERQYEIRK